MKYGKGLAFWAVVGMAVAGSAGTARAQGRGPQLWMGAVDGELVRVYTDGERCVGGMTLGGRFGTMQATLLGVRPQEQATYRGNYGGTVRNDSGRHPAAGKWTFTPKADEREMVVSLPVRNSPAVAVSLQQPQQAPTLRAGWVMGNVTVRRGGQAQPLRLGDRVAPGDTVATGSGSAAIVVLGDRSVAVMQAATTLVLPQGTFNGEREIERVRVQSGKIWFAVRKLGGGQKFEVETGQAVAAVRGTEFVVEVDAGRDAVTMTDGTVEMSLPGAGGGGFPVVEGRAWDHRAGGMPQVARVNLLPVLEEWAPLLEVADYCWPYRLAGRQPFWKNIVPKGVPMNFQRVPPEQLEIAALVATLNVPVAEAPAPQPEVQVGRGQGGGVAAGQPVARRVQVGGNDDEDGDGGGRRGRGRGGRGNGSGIAKAAAGLVVGGLIGGLGRRVGGGMKRSKY